MSSSALFTLVTNDGKQDKLLMATDWLRCRLQKLTDLYVKKAPPGTTPKTPSLDDIEKTHILYINAHYKPYVSIAFEYNRAATQGAKFGSNFSFPILQYGDFFTDMAIHIRVGAIAAPDATSDPVTGLRLRYCDYLGVRALDYVEFSVNNNILDSYDPDSYMMTREFTVNTDKTLAWNRCVGQETVDEGYVYMFEPQLKQMTYVKEGLQTFKKTQPGFDLFIPLDFWYKTPELAISSLSIPFGQRFINGKLATLDKLLGAANVTLVAGPPSYYTMAAAAVPSTVVPNIEAMELYTNNLFVQPEISDLYIKKIGFNMIRVHRIQHKLVSDPTGSIQLASLKWPIETMYFGFRPQVNTTSFEDWYKFCQVTLTNYQVPVITGLSTVVGRNVQLRSTAPVATSLTFEAYSIVLNKDAPSAFYNAYTPYNFGVDTINSPVDIGKYMLNLNLYPGKYQASGYLNTSRAREIYLKYESTYISASNICEFVMVGIALNFLLIADGSALLRYQT